MALDNKHSSFPPSWLVHFRWGKGKKEKQRDGDGEPIEFSTVGGRTTAIVKSRQRMAGWLEEEKGDRKRKPEWEGRKEKEVEVKSEEVKGGSGTNRSTRRRSSAVSTTVKVASGVKRKRSEVVKEEVEPKTKRRRVNK